MNLTDAVSISIGLSMIVMGGAQFVKGNKIWSIIDFLLGMISVSWGLIGI